MAVQLAVLVRVGIEVILWQLFGSFRPERVPSHIYNSDRADRQIFMPKMELYEDVRLVVDRGEDVLTRSLLEICTILLDSLEQEQKLMRL